MRQYGRAFTARSGFTAKPGLRTTNHCETTLTTAAGVTSQTAIFTGVSGPSNRSTHIPEGSTLKRILLRMWATDATPVAGKHQCLLFFRPGSQSFTDPIASWYSTADPLTEEAIDIRRGVLQKRGPHTLVTITGASFSPYMVCSWRGSKVVRDGDDVVWAQLDAGITNWTAECIASYIM